MLNCSRCGMDFSYGYEFDCIHQFRIFLLEKGQWKCSGCGLQITSTHKIMSIQEVQNIIDETKREGNAHF